MTVSAKPTTTRAEARRRAAEVRKHAAMGIVSSFNSMPDSAWVPLGVVQLLFGCSEPTVWRASRDGRLPRHRTVIGSARWNVGELRAKLARPS
jgi:predicted DNA-binding transcriptional regulator AlpA